MNKKTKNDKVEFMDKVKKFIKEKFQTNLKHIIVYFLMISYVIYIKSKKSIREKCCTEIFFLFPEIPYRIVKTILN